LHAKRDYCFSSKAATSLGGELRGWEADSSEAVVVRRGRVAVVTASFAPDLADLIRALAALAWPALIFGFLLLFREEISEGINRFRKGKGPAGIEVELDALKVKTEAAEQSLEAAPDPTPVQTSGRTQGDTAELPKEDDEGDEGGGAAAGSSPSPTKPSGPTQAAGQPRWPWESAASPALALLSLAAEIERKSRELLVSQGKPEQARSPRGLRTQLRVLDASPTLRQAADEFMVVRNQLVHGHRTRERDVLRAVDLGARILLELEKIPHELNYVVDPEAETFADAEGATKHPFYAVVLRSVHPPDGTETFRAYPTADSHLPRGEPVTWEWNMDKIYPEAWYRHPETGELAYGWTSAAEFAGRPIHRYGEEPLRASRTD